MIHANGSANFHDVETFTGTVNGVAGTVTFHLTGHNDADLVVHETRTVTGATGGLAGLHGVLHEVGTVVFPTGPGNDLQRKDRARQPMTSTAQTTRDRRQETQA